jgi:hypothetical protein
MVVHTEFELLRIDITEEDFPINLRTMHVPDMNTHSWAFSHSFRFDSFNDGYDFVIASMSFDLINDEDEDEAPIIHILVENIFKITAGLESTEKAAVLELFLNIMIGNIQGILAAKFEGTPMADILPPDMNSEQYSQEILNIVNDEWSE